jgi:uncharacterized protein (DUF1697 family)
MPRYAAFLRGMNLGGRRITNEALRAHVAALEGVADVATFRASGNVTFDTHAREPVDALAQRVESGLAAALGYDVPVFLRSAAEVRAIAAHAPFPAKRVAASNGKLQVLLLHDAPAASAARDVLALATDDDQLDLHARELYWLPRDRMSDSALDLTAIAKLLGPGTQRTMGTLELIAQKHFED